MNLLKKFVYMAASVARILRTASIMVIICGVLLLVASIAVIVVFDRAEISSYTDRFALQYVYLSCVIAASIIIAGILGIISAIWRNILFRIVTSILLALSFIAVLLLLGYIISYTIICSEILWEFKERYFALADDCYSVMQSSTLSPKETMSTSTRSQTEKTQISTRSSEETTTSSISSKETMSTSTRSPTEKTNISTRSSEETTTSSISPKETTHISTRFPEEITHSSIESTQIHRKKRSKNQDDWEPTIRGTDSDCRIIVHVHKKNMSFSVESTELISKENNSPEGDKSTPSLNTFLSNVQRSLAHPDRTDNNDIDLKLFTPCDVKSIATVESVHQKFKRTPHTTIDIANAERIYILTSNKSIYIDKSLNNVVDKLNHTVIENRILTPFLDELPDTVNNKKFNTFGTNEIANLKITTHSLTGDSPEFLKHNSLGATKSSPYMVNSTTIFAEETLIALDSTSKFVNRYRTDDGSSKSTVLNNLFDVNVRIDRDFPFKYTRSVDVSNDISSSELYQNVHGAEFFHSPGINNQQKSKEGTFQRDMGYENIRLRTKTCETRRDHYQKRNKCCGWQEREEICHDDHGPKSCCEEEFVENGKCPCDKAFKKGCKKTFRFALYFYAYLLGGFAAIASAIILTSLILVLMLLIIPQFSHIEEPEA